MKNQKGITLIALIITIIVMLILVGVTVTVALNGGLFSKAKQAKGNTENEVTAEQKLATGKVKVGEKWYASYQDYLDGIEYTPGIILDKERIGLAIPSEYNSETSPVTDELTVDLNQIEGEVTWTNSDETIAKVVVEGSKGTITAVGEGETTITLSCTYEGETYTKTCTVSVLLIPTAWDTTKVDALVDGESIIPVPKGFTVSTLKTEDEVDEGLVIKDGDNEFVWVPVTNATTYTETNFGPLTGDYTVNDTIIGPNDSYQVIQYFYGDALGTINSEETFNATFTYSTDKTNVEESVQTYGGFYVGRYETTYDSVDEDGVPQGIGVKRGKNVLVTNSILKAGTNTGEGKSGKEFYYRWWGFYKVQKDMYATNENVGSCMIGYNQWDEILTFTNYKSITRPADTYTNTPDLSGSAYIGTTDTYDVSKNIYDLAGNLKEATMRASSSQRYYRGGYFNSSSPGNSSQYAWGGPSGAARWNGSRVALYIR